MSDALIAFYRRPHDETPAQFGARLRDAAAALAGKGGVRELVLLVDDGETRAPPEAAAYPSTFDAAVVADGLPLAALPSPDAAFAIRRRVIKARDRGRDGARSEGFTVICPSVRAPFLTHDQ